MSVDSLCNKNVITVTKTASIKDAAQIMREKSVGCLLVVEEEVLPQKLVGLITDRDITLEVVSKGLTPESVTVEDIMVRNPISVPGETGLYNAIHTMQENGIKRLPVLGKDKHLLGIITLDDINQFLSREMFKVNSISQTQIVKEKQGELLAERFYA